MEVAVTQAPYNSKHYSNYSTDPYCHQQRTEYYYQNLDQIMMDILIFTHDLVSWPMLNWFVIRVVATDISTRHCCYYSHSIDLSLVLRFRCRVFCLAGPA